MVGKQIYDKYLEVCETESVTPVEFDEFADTFIDYFVDKTRESIKVDKDMETLHLGATRIGDEMNMVIFFNEDAELSISFNTWSIEKLRSMLSGGNEDLDVIVNEN